MLPLLLAPFVWWTSEDSGSFSAGHTFITRQAIEIVKNDGQMPPTLYKNLLEMPQIVNEPDSFETTYWSYVGHFYDPDTEKNYLGTTFNTALTNFIHHAIFAVDPHYEEWVKSLSYSLHYLEDACVPHHASNLIVGYSKHYDFEHYAQSIQEQATVYFNVYPYTFTDDFQNDLREILRGCAIKAKRFANPIEETDKEMWLPYAKTTMEQAQYYTALAIARIVKEREN